MNRSQADNWLDANQRYLSAALAVVRESLEQYSAKPARTKAGAELGSAKEALHAAAAAMPAPAALETLRSTFRLSAFERDVLLLSAGMELDSNFAELCRGRSR